MRCAAVIATVATAALVAAPSAVAQESQSAAAAAALCRLMQQQGLEALVTPDPADPDRFIGALHFPGAQLLVVSAAYPARDALAHRIAAGEHRDAYLDIVGGGVRDGRFFVTDLGADGLQRTRERNEPFDVTYTDGANQISYNGDWRAQQLTRSAYDARFMRDDERYARMLRALASGLAPSGGAVAEAAMPDAVQP